MATMLKTLKDLLLQNYWENGPETLYVASGTVVLQNLCKMRSLVGIDLIYGKANFVSIGIWLRKAEMLLYSRIWKWSELYHIWMLEVKVISGLFTLEPVTW